MGGRSRFIGLCRGQGYGYAVFSVAGEVPVYEEAFTLKDRRVPSALYELDDLPFERNARMGDMLPLVVVVFPLFDVPLEIALYEGDRLGVALARCRYNPIASKVQSRLFTRRYPLLAERMRGIEHRRSVGRSEAFLGEFWPAGDEFGVWRARFRLSAGLGVEKTDIRVLDARAEELACDCTVLEDQIVASEDDASRQDRLLTVSIKLPRSISSACVSIADPGTERSLCFALALPGVIRDSLDYFGALTSGGSIERAYPRWYEAHRATPEVLAWQTAQKLDDAPMLSVLLLAPCGLSQLVSKTIGSLLAQSYVNWELLILGGTMPDGGSGSFSAGIQDGRVRILDASGATASSAYWQGVNEARGVAVALIEEGCTLEPDALYRFALCFSNDPELDLVYCDEDRLMPDGRIEPIFKSEPDLTSLWARNSLGSLLMLRKEMLEQLGAPDDAVAANLSHDLALKGVERARHICHLSLVLHHSCSQVHQQGGLPRDVLSAGKVAIERSLSRSGLLGKVCFGGAPETYQTTLDLPNSVPRVSIIIPNRDHAALLERCVRSVLDRTSYSDFEVMIVENGSVGEDTFETYRRLSGDPRVHVVAWSPEQLGDAPSEKGFNYSSLVNFGARESSGEFLLFLNNDTEVVNSSWLNAMVSCFGRDVVGVVGAKLLFQDGLVQHAGMVADAQGNFRHINRNLYRDEPGYLQSAVLPREFSMVTGACQMTRRALFERIGGYDEQLAVGFNDGDYCLSARELGYVTVFQPGALLYHREFSSRGREEADVNLRARFMREKAYVTAKHAEFFAASDPAVNPNLDHMTDWWALPQDS